MYYIYDFRQKKCILKKPSTLYSGLYCIGMRSVESYGTLNQKFNDSKYFYFGMIALVTKKCASYKELADCFAQ